MKTEHYEVYALSSTASDVLTCDTLEDARAKADKWAKESVGTTIVVVKVTEVVVNEMTYTEVK